MAHSAAAAARTRLASSRPSSPYDDNAFATATGTSFKDIIHSTPQREYEPTIEDLPLHHNHFQEQSEHDSDGSAEMSIEMGRGVKRSARRDNDISSELVFNFGNDNSQYETMGTPPVGPRNSQPKPDGSLRKAASVRRATESARGNEALKKATNGAKQRAVSDNLNSLRAGQSQQPPGTGTVHSSRFVSSRSMSTTYGAIPTRFTVNGGLETAQQTPRRPAQGNATAQSATYTSQSFMLPDFPDITELVSGTRRDGTPKRGNPVRSRFASATYRPLTQGHATIEGVAIPEDEKAIFVSLEHAREKNARLEFEKSEGHKRIEELELEVAELRNQLQMANRRPDSALGSEDDTLDARGFQTDKARLQGKVEALQERLSKSERKISVAEITSTRVVKERDGLVTQMAAVYFQNEELSNENQDLRAAQTELSNENEALKKTVEDLQDENGRLKDMWSDEEDRKESSANKRPETGDQQEVNKLHRSQLTKKSERVVRGHTGDKAHDGQAHRRRSSDHHDSTFVRDLASRIEREVRKMREDAASGAQSHSTGVRDQRLARTRSRSRSKTRSNVRYEEPISLRRHISAPAEITTGASDFTTGQSMPINQRKVLHGADEMIAQEDLTELSVLDPDDVANLRRKLEEEKRSGRLRKRASSIPDAEAENTAHSVSRHSMPRKSSLKDLTGGVDSGTGRFSLRGDDASRLAKTVRVQSPHSSQDILEPEQSTEAGNVSMLNNTSRRRRRTSNTEGETSTFILPDITLRGTQMSRRMSEACIDHNTANCTACAQDVEEVSIPKPVPVSERDLGDVADATIRPSQSPDEALATVIKNLEDEIKHLKLQRESQNRLYNQHDPALSKRRRQDVRAKIDLLTAQIEKRSDQVYALYDVVEGQKQQAEAAKAKGEHARGVSEQEIEETLESIGLDPVHLSGHVGRKAPAGLDDADEMSDESELPWEGLSDVESEEEIRGFGKEMR